MHNLVLNRHLVIILIVCFAPGCISSEEIGDRVEEVNFDITLVLMGDSHSDISEGTLSDDQKSMLLPLSSSNCEGFLFSPAIEFAMMNSSSRPIAIDEILQEEGGTGKAGSFLKDFLGGATTDQQIIERFEEKLSLVRFSDKIMVDTSDRENALQNFYTFLNNQHSSRIYGFVSNANQQDLIGYEFGTKYFDNKNALLETIAGEICEQHNAGLEIAPVVVLFRPDGANPPPPPPPPAYSNNLEGLLATIASRSSSEAQIDQAVQAVMSLCANPEIKVRKLSSTGIVVEINSITHFFGSTPSLKRKLW